MTAERGEVEALVGTLRETLNDIDAALAKFEGGNYGDLRVVRRPDRRGPARGDARGPPLHRRCASKRALSPLASVNIDHITIFWFVALVVAVILHEISHGVVALVVR